jgi:succinate dehydrogenase hydrophobic anchor subunit
MSSHHFDPAPHFAPKVAPAKLYSAAKVMILVGAICYGGGLYLGGLASESARGTFLVNLVYFLGLSAGGMAFSAILTASLARWGRGLKRLAEGFSAFLPWILVLFGVFLATGGMDIYEWNTPEGAASLHAHKAAYLTPVFWTVRLVVALAILTLLSKVLIRHSLRPDLIAAQSALGESAPNSWASITSGAGELEAEVEASQVKQRALSAIIIPVYALLMTMTIVDLVMSLSPHWYSNMFGGWFFVSCVWVTMMWLGMYTAFSRKWMGIQSVLTPTVYHDLGKMVFGFGVLWAYMFYAQLLPIWYGNMTEEIGFLIVRLRLEPWNDIAKIVGTMCFLIPFTTLLSRGIKKKPTQLAIVFMIPAVGVWLERFLVALPSIWNESTLPYGAIEFGITLGFIGGFLLVVTKFITSVPIVPVTDPHMQPHPEDVHVESLDKASAH